MITKFKSFFVLVLALALSSVAFGQAVTPSTTFSVAVGTFDLSVSLTSVSVTTTSGTYAVSSAVQGAFQTVLYVDREAIGVISVNGKVASVQRGIDGTIVSPHTTTAVVWFGQPNWFSQSTHQPAGSCTATNELALPRFFELFGEGWTCGANGTNKGQWVLQYANPASYATSDTSQFGNPAQGTCHFQYNFAVDGGAVGTIVPANNCVIPKGALITGCTMYASTAGTTSASGTLSIGISGTGGATNALLAATAAASITGVLQCAVVPQTASGFLHMTTAGAGEVAIATGALTAGIVDVWAYYVTSPL